MKNLPSNLMAKLMVCTIVSGPVAASGAVTGEKDTLEKFNQGVKHHKLISEGFGQYPEAGKFCVSCGDGVLKTLEVLDQENIEHNLEDLKVTEPIMNQEDAYTITVDGVTIGDEEAQLDNHGHPNPVNFGENFNDDERIHDILMDNLNIQTKFDGLRLEPKLDVISSIETAIPGQEIVFNMYSNYIYWLKNAEIRIFKHDSAQPVLVKEFAPSETASITLPIVGEYDYTLRVYDRHGNFDESARKNLRVVESREAVEGDISKYRDRTIKDIYGKTSLDTQNIALNGGTITVYGNEVPKTKKAFVYGQEIPMAGGTFVEEQIMPNGTHELFVDLLLEDDKYAMIDRTAEIPYSDWFYVGNAEITVGKNDANGPAELLTGNDNLNGETYVDARLGLYAKGKIKGKYNITIAANTDEEDVEDIFNNLDKKDARQLFRRIDPDRYYTTYGDDSEIVEDAPTQGKFYAKVGYDKNHIMWGNFRTKIADTEFGKVERGLYGGGLHYESQSATKYGEKHVVVDGFIAEPGTLAVREEQRGTGGSSYLLQRQDLSIGSEKVRIELRDPTTGVVLQSNLLIPYEDYDINYIQGRILLTNPLPSVANDGNLVNSGGLSGNEVFLVVHYEYTPAFTDLDSFTTGGRASAWLGDYVKLGVTSQNENTTGSDQELLAGDVTVRYSEDSYLRGEFGVTKGPWVGAIGSGDGGFNFNQIAQDRTADIKAESFRVEGALNLADLNENFDGKIYGFYQDKEQGFSAPGHLTLFDTKQWGANLELKVFDRLKLDADFHSSLEEANVENENGNVNLILDISDRVYVGVGAEYDKRNNLNPLTIGGINGERIDGAARIGFKDKDKWDAYVFGQKTFKNDGNLFNNDRYGVGANVQVNDKINLGAELSNGDGGIGAQLSGKYKYAEGSELYLAYQLDGDNASTGFNALNALSGNRGTFTIGNRTRYSDTLSFYAEERATHNRTQVRDITQLYGVEFKPTDNFSLSGSFEHGIIDRGEPTQRDRTAGSATMGYARDGVTVSTSLEIRDDESNAEDRLTYLTRNNLAIEVSDDWRLQGKFNYARSESSRGNFFDGDYTEGSLGFAYRPTENDDLNALFKYTYLYDLPGNEQVTATGINPGYKQKSHILSADFIYDFNEWLSLGAKYGYKRGEVTVSRTDNQFFDSNAHLGIIRADIHVLHNWDLLAEARLLKVEEAKDARFGALGGIYYHLNNNLKIGGGYSFVDFTDDLTNLDYNSEGPFLNTQLKF